MYCPLDTIFYINLAGSAQTATLVSADDTRKYSWWAGEQAGHTSGQKQTRLRPKLRLLAKERGHRILIKKFQIIIASFRTSRAWVKMASFVRYHGNIVSEKLVPR